MPNILEKGPFLVGSKNGVGPSALLKTLENHYTDLAAAYLQKGMKRESQLFGEAAEELKAIILELKESSTVRTSEE